MEQDPKILAGVLVFMLEKNPSFDAIRRKVKVNKECVDALIHALLFISEAKNNDKEAATTETANTPSSAVGPGKDDQPLTPPKYIDMICDMIKNRTGACTDPDCDKSHPVDCVDYDKCQPHCHPDCPNWHTFLPISVHLANQEEARKRRKEQLKAAKARVVRHALDQPGNGARRKKPAFSGPNAASKQTGSHSSMRPTLSEWFPQSSLRG